MQTAEKVHTCHILLSSQVCGSNACSSAELPAALFQKPIKAIVVAMHQGNFPGSAKQRWLGFFGQAPMRERPCPLPLRKGLSFLFQDLSRILIRWTEIL